MSASLSEFAVGVLMGSWAALGLMLVLARLRARHAGGAEGATRKRDMQSWLGIGLQGVGFAMAWSIDRERGAAWWPEAGALLAVALPVVAMVLAVASTAFAGAALRTLDKQWSLTARVRGDHELIQRGPFARVRHPIYTALFGLLLATALCLAQAWVLPAAAAVYLVGTHWRAAREERLLAEMFGAQYADYRARVPRLIPRWTPRA